MAYKVKGTDGLFDQTRESDYDFFGEVVSSSNLKDLWNGASNNTQNTTTFLPKAFSLDQPNAAESQKKPTKFLLQSTNLNPLGFLEEGSEPRSAQKGSQPGKPTKFVFSQEDQSNFWSFDSASTNNSSSCSLKLAREASRSEENFFDFLEQSEQSEKISPLPTKKLFVNQQKKKDLGICTASQQRKGQPSLSRDPEDPSAYIFPEVDLALSEFPSLTASQLHTILGECINEGNVLKRQPVQQACQEGDKSISNQDLCSGSFSDYSQSKAQLRHTRWNQCLGPDQNMSLQSSNQVKKESASSRMAAQSHTSVGARPQSKYTNSLISYPSSQISLSKFGSYESSKRSPVSLECPSLGVSSRQHRLVIIDCRFDYEYLGGHIQSAINICSPIVMQALFTEFRPFLFHKAFLDRLLELEGQPLSLQSLQAVREAFEAQRRPAPGQGLEVGPSQTKPFPDQAEGLAGPKRGFPQPDSIPVFMFHCEFSSQRGPKMWRLVRRLDRERNEYPALDFFDMFILKGGYESFVEQFGESQSYCGGYRSMYSPYFKKERNIEETNLQQQWDSVQKQ